MREPGSLTNIEAAALRRFGSSPVPIRILPHCCGSVRMRHDADASHGISILKPHVAADLGLKWFSQGG
ncbi:hypothetical protein, partial [Bradyrhizobium sp.]|uniref:hypothetical protein n=1 Tax=Bradyrhizobium sp. TaxID=376 RepID=UPI0025C2EBE5